MKKSILSKLLKKTRETRGKIGYLEKTSDTLPVKPLSSNALCDHDGIYRFDSKKFNKNLSSKYLEATRPISKCVVCNGKTFKKFLRKNIRKQEEIFEKHIELSQELIQCTNCGLIMVKNILHTDFYFEFINSFYQNGYYPKSDVEIQSIESIYQGKLNFFKRLLKDLQVPLGSRVLEVSSFYGVAINDLSKDFDVYGIEVENLPAHFSVNHYPSLKDRVINDLFENCLSDLSDLCPFQVVFFTMSFRQISEPQKALEILKKIIPEGGLIIIYEGAIADFIFYNYETPNAISLSFSHNKSFYYGIDNMTYLFAKYGFKRISCGFIGKNPAEAGDQSYLIFRSESCKANPNDLKKSLNKMTEVVDFYQLHNIDKIDTKIQN